MSSAALRNAIEKKTTGAKRRNLLSYIVDKDGANTIAFPHGWQYNYEKQVLLKNGQLVANLLKSMNSQKTSVHYPIDHFCW